MRATKSAREPPSSMTVAWTALRRCHGPWSTRWRPCRGESRGSWAWGHSCRALWVFQSKILSIVWTSVFQLLLRRFPHDDLSETTINISRSCIVDLHDTRSFLRAGRIHSHSSLKFTTDKSPALVGSSLIKFKLVKHLSLPLAIDNNNNVEKNTIPQSRSFYNKRRMIISRR